MFNTEKFLSTIVNSPYKFCTKWFSVMGVTSGEREAKGPAPIVKSATPPLSKVLFIVLEYVYYNSYISIVLVYTVCTVRYRISM